MQAQRLPRCGATDVRCWFSTNSSLSLVFTLHQRISLSAAGEKGRLPWGAPRLEPLIIPSSSSKSPGALLSTDGGVAIASDTTGVVAGGGSVGVRHRAEREIWQTRWQKLPQRPRSHQERRRGGTTPKEEEEEEEEEATKIREKDHEDEGDGEEEEENEKEEGDEEEEEEEEEEEQCRDRRQSDSVYATRRIQPRVSQPPSRQILVACRSAVRTEKKTGWPWGHRGRPQGRWSQDMVLVSAVSTYRMANTQPMNNNSGF